MPTEGGMEWAVELYGCPAESLRDRPRLSKFFRQVVREMDLHPVGAIRWHRFPGTGGLTGFWILKESHLACHTFPELGSACFNLFCCRPRPAWDWKAAAKEALGARSVRVRKIRRPYARILHARA